MAAGMATVGTKQAIMDHVNILKTGFSKSILFYFWENKLCTTDGLFWGGVGHSNAYA